MEIKEGTLVVGRLQIPQQNILGIVYEEVKQPNRTEFKMTKEWWVLCHPIGGRGPNHSIEERNLKALAYLSKEELKLLREGKISPAQALLAHLPEVIVQLF